MAVFGYVRMMGDGPLDDAEWNIASLVDMGVPRENVYVDALDGTSAWEALSAGLGESDILVLDGPFCLGRDDAREIEDRWRAISKGGVRIVVMDMGIDVQPITPDADEGTRMMGDLQAIMYAQVAMALSHRMERAQRFGRLVA